MPGKASDGLPDSENGATPVTVEWLSTDKWQDTEKGFG